MERRQRRTRTSKPARASGRRRSHGRRGPRCGSPGRAEGWAKPAREGTSAGGLTSSGRGAWGVGGASTRLGRSGELRADPARRCGGGGLGTALRSAAKELREARHDPVRRHGEPNENTCGQAEGEGARLHWARAREGRGNADDGDAATARWSGPAWPGPRGARSTVGSAAGARAQGALLLPEGSMVLR